MTPADRAAFLAEARRWIAYDTVTTRSNAAFASHLARRFRALGFRVRLQRVRLAGVPFVNFIARRGPARGRPLLLNTHLDTVPPGPLAAWSGNPWRARLSGGRLVGLGVADVKLNLLCQWRALRELGPARFRRPLCVVGTFGEERGLLGVQRLVKAWRGPKPLFALVGEPSRFRVVRRHRGYLVFEWTLPRVRVEAGRARALVVRGRAAHSSTPELGVNAIVRALENLDRAAAPAAVLDLDGGAAPNQVPAECRLRTAPAGRRPVAALPWRVLLRAARDLPPRLPSGYSLNVGTAKSDHRGVRVLFDLRYPPGHDSRRIVETVRRRLACLCADSRLPLRLRVERDNPPLDQRLSSPALRRAARALRRAGLPVRFESKPTCTEAGIYARWGVPAAVWGPGRSRGNAHGPDESISVRDLERAARFYRIFLEDFCLHAS